MNRWEKQNNYNHGNHCHYQQKHVSLFVLSVDFIIGKLSLVILVILSRLMASKMDEPISHVRGCINRRVSIVFVRSYSCMIRVYFLPSPMCDQDTYWYPGSGNPMAQNPMTLNPMRREIGRASDSCTCSHFWPSNFSPIFIQSLLYTQNYLFFTPVFFLLLPLCQ